MQVTAGRASQPLDAEMAELVWKRLKSLIPQEQMQRIVHVASENALPATLQKALAVQAFGFAAGHVSKPNRRCITVCGGRCMALAR